MTEIDDEREALADRLARRLIDDPKQLMLAEGTGALHVALSESIRSVIEDVYADCGDSDPGVLSSNIAQRLAWDLPPAILADAGFRRSEVPEPNVSESSPGEMKAQGEPSDADRRALAEFIDKALDGDAGYGVGTFLAGGILSFLANRAALRAAPTETSASVSPDAYSIPLGRQVGPTHEGGIPRDSNPLTHPGEGNVWEEQS